MMPRGGGDGGGLRGQSEWFQEGGGLDASLLVAAQSVGAGQGRDKEDHDLLTRGTPLEVAGCSLAGAETWL